jgi:hypothetical protein
VREIRSLRAMWRALETGSSLKIYAPALDPTEVLPDAAGFINLKSCVVGILDKRKVLTFEATGLQ